MTNASSSFAPVAQPAPTRVRSVPSSGFPALAALGAAFGGLLSYGRNPDLLSTTIAVGLTFLGALVLLYVLHIAFRLAVVVAKVAIPVAVLLLIGCALHWPGAESVAHWLSGVGHHGAELAARGWAALQTR